MSVIPKTKFCEIAFIKSVTPIDNNMDDEQLVPFVYIAQDVHIQKILGETFYNHLRTAGAAGTLTDVEKEFLQNYVIYPLAHWTHYEALPSIRTKITNKGTQIESSEHSQSADLNDLKYTRADVRNVAEYYDSILISHLCHNSSTYPTYQNPNADENINSSSRKFFGGVYMPKP